MSLTQTSSIAAENDHAMPTGWRRYVYSTNHKDIGRMHLVFALCAGTIGIAFSVLLRAELEQQGKRHVGQENQERDCENVRSDRGDEVPASERIGIITMTARQAVILSV